MMMMMRTMCPDANACGFVNVPCGTHCLGLDAYAMRCVDDALYTCQTAAKYETPSEKRKVLYLLSVLLSAHITTLYSRNCILYKNAFIRHYHAT